MTLPSQVSCLRILLTAVAVGMLFADGVAAKGAALGAFLLASFTDWLDGYLARRWNQTSPLGAVLDPIADKVLVLGMFAAFVQLGLVLPWMVALIAVRELAITGVRLFALGRRVVLAAAKEGKHKTISQMLTIALILGVLIAREAVEPGRAMDLLVAWGNRVILAAMWVTLILTVSSGVSFVWRYRVILGKLVGR